MFKPSAHQVITPLHAKSRASLWVCNRLAHRLNEFRGDPFVGIGVIHPFVLERDVLQSPVLVRGPVVERALGDPGAELLRDRHRVVRAHGVKDVNIVGPRQAFQASWQVLLLVFGQDDNGNSNGLVHASIPCARFLMNFAGKPA